MEHEMKNLEIAKSYFSNFAKPKLDPKDVCVPNEILEECEEKMKKYREVIKENRHASAKSKAFHFLYGEEHKDESERKENLQTIFNETGAWFWYVKETFKGCKGSEKIQKYVDEMQKDFNKLKRKGYIKQLTKEYVNNFPKENKGKMFNKEKYALKNNPIFPVAKNTNNYGAQLAKTYTFFYLKLCEILLHYDQQFAARVKAAKDVQEDTTQTITEIIDKATEVLNEYDEMYDQIEKGLDEYDDHIKDSPKLQREREKIIETYNENTETLSNDISSLKKINMNAIFKRYSELDRVTENMENIQLFNKYLIKFYRIATSNNHQFSELKKYYEYLAKLYKELQPTLDKITTTQGRPLPLSSGQENAITRQICYYKNKATETLRDFREKYRDFQSEEKNFQANYKQYQIEKATYKKMMKFHAAFAILGIALPVFSALTPLIQLMIAPTPAPVGPAPVANPPQG